MLASPLVPTPHSFSTQHGQDDYRPAKDLETFNKLLPPPIEFIEGSSSGAYAVPDGKYKPINVPAPASEPKTPAKLEKSADLKSATTVSTGNSAKVAEAGPSSSSTQKAQGKSLWSSGIDLSWPASVNIGAGLHNLGNTCFLNSALQCLLHTPPLLHVLNGHTPESCRNDKFCMTCSLRTVARQSHDGQKRTFSPSAITNRLQTIAKHLRRGRQEDTHEFLRYAIDALQKACLYGHPPKIDPKLAETTWVHKIFGGRLRSRVTCQSCGHNSDTFDRILDLSLDIWRLDSVKEALRKFVAVDYLKGADKYKCEKCKKPVNAEKRFTIHEAPAVLTVHLKRFSPMGRKIAHHVEYDERLNLHPYMSKDQFGPTYSLYGVICHAGSGPNSGHYYAFVKSRDGRWYEMNDESVSPISSAPTSKKSAYMLFYIRDKGQGLEAAVKSKASHSTGNKPPRLSEGMKGMKRKERDMDDSEDVGEKVSSAKPLLGPLLPSPTINGTARPSDDDPQARAIKAKIQAAQEKKARSTMSGLSQYHSDDEDGLRTEGEGEKDGAHENGNSASSPANTHDTDVEMRPSSPSNPPPRTSSPAGDASNGIAPSSFYGSNPSNSNRPPKRRKSFDNSERGHQKRPHGVTGNKIKFGNPYNSVTTYSSKNKKRRAPRGI